ncbi:MAG: asparagine synthase (glutamine-hydrolyzing) [Candidatus Zixiibacteriota bacterium]|nr:MAG: asparagine synthase (glutamine-hydrolyzing) [candidate division Zixibacteria bacterium]
MCGILAVISKNGHPLPRRDITFMRDLMTHRGPDDAGLFIDETNGVALAHRRLSILDLSSSGKQPMRSPQGNYISFNGEIYNYTELKAEFLSQQQFVSSSDTAVLLHMIEKYGEDALNRLNGMWAFVYFEPEKQQLLISRDRYGIKPLYYLDTSEVTILSSEIKPILASPYYTRELNQDAVDVYLHCGLVDGLEETFFKGIKRFPAASYCRYSLRNKELNFRKYYSIEQSVTTLDGDWRENVQTFKDLFFDSVKLRMRSDVPVGTCLSGGLDSSSIYSTASEILSDKLSSFSAKFSEQEYDESYFYNRVLQKYPGNNSAVKPSFDNFEDQLKKIIYYLEEPSKAMGVFPQWHVMELAARGVKVLLDGQGGDEILAGYDYYKPYCFLDDFRHRPHKLPVSLTGYAVHNGVKPLLKLPLNVLKILLKERTTFNGSFLSQRLLNDVTVDMLPALLKYEDKIGMAFSIEARVPFLDYRLVDFVFSLRESYKINNGWSKKILRESMRDILPDEIINRIDKKGFPTPLESVLTGNKHLNKLYPEAARDTWTKWRYISLHFWREIFDMQDC